MMKVLREDFGNPSALHGRGMAAEQYIRDSRKKIAATLKAKEKEIFFTSGGTEANNLALVGCAMANRRSGRHLITTSIEHPSVENPMRYLEEQGFEVTRLGVDRRGVIDLQELREALRPDTILVSMMHVNNEIGAVEPIEEAAAVIRQKQPSCLFHVDAIQSYGKYAIYPRRIGVDLLSVSGHKIHGPKGVGALYVSKNARILPRTFGGGQERELRPGTEAAPLIAGLGAAVEELPDWRQSYSRMEKLRDYTLQKLSGLEGVEVNSPVEGLPYLLNFSALGIRSETMLHFLAQRGIYVSSGSACAKGKQSHVLKAAGLPDSRISSAIRVSFSRENTERDADALAEGVREGLACLARARR